MTIVNTGSEKRGAGCEDEAVCRDPEDAMVAVPAGLVYLTVEVIV